MSWIAEEVIPPCPKCGGACKKLLLSTYCVAECDKVFSTGESILSTGESITVFGSDNDFDIYGRVPCNGTGTWLFFKEPKPRTKAFKFPLEQVCHRESTGVYVAIKTGAKPIT